MQRAAINVGETGVSVAASQCLAATDVLDRASACAVGNDTRISLVGSIGIDEFDCRTIGGNAPRSCHPANQVDDFAGCPIDGAGEVDRRRIDTTVGIGASDGNVRSTGDSTAGQLNTTEPCGLGLTRDGHGTRTARAGDGCAVDHDTCTVGRAARTTHDDCRTRERDGRTGVNTVTRTCTRVTRQ